MPNELDNPIRPNKAELANRAIRKHKLRSFADLGACWGVNAGYTLDLLAKNEIEKAFVVDVTVTHLARERGTKYPQLSFVSGLFGEKAVMNSVPNVDALLMYDILLHQVAPNWDEFLTLWSAKTKALVIYNQMWMREGPTIRFVDQGREWYKANIPLKPTTPVDRWFDQHDEIEPETGRKQRDRHSYSQWGIKTEDLIAHVRSLGFRLDFFEQHGDFKVPWMKEQAFIFVRDP